MPPMFYSARRLGVIRPLHAATVTANYIVFGRYVKEVFVLSALKHEWNSASGHGGNFHYHGSPAAKSRRKPTGSPDSWKSIQIET